MVASCQIQHFAGPSLASNHWNSRKCGSVCSPSSSHFQYTDQLPCISSRCCGSLGSASSDRRPSICSSRRHSRYSEVRFSERIASSGFGNLSRSSFGGGLEWFCGLRIRMFQIVKSTSLKCSRSRGQKYVPCKCSSSDAMGTSEEGAENWPELPLFPLPLVLFPGAILPLQIFEFRYRIMMHTLLQTDLRFGVVYMDKSSGLSRVGCVGEVVKHERLVDDRFFMICKGQERFRVIGIVRTKPYLVARVEWVEDRPSREQEDVDALANEVETYMKDVIRLSNRVNGKPEKAAPDDLRKNLFPTPFSFWVGSTFEGAPIEQQALLELEDTAQRLKREKETLRNTLHYLSAASAVKDAFPSTG